MNTASPCSRFRDHIVLLDDSRAAAGMPQTFWNIASAILPRWKNAPGGGVIEKTFRHGSGDAPGLSIRAIV